MSPAELSILSTLALYSAEGRSALTQDEIYFYFHKPENTTSHFKPTEKEFVNYLAELQQNGQIFKYGDYYSLENRPGIAEENIKKARQSVEKIKKNKWPLRFFRAVPFARAIAVTGSVALQNARPTSDLDLLIIAQKGRIWTARIIALLILEIFGRRREKSKEKICLNFFAAENAAAPIQNIASANMLLRAIPLFGRKKYYEFLAQNRWTENFIYSPAKTSPENERAPFAAKIFEYFLSGKSGDALEEFFKHWQYRRLLRKIVSPEHLDHLVLTDEILMLHYPNPKNAKIMSMFRSST